MKQIFLVLLLPLFLMSSCGKDSKNSPADTEQGTGEAKAITYQIGESWGRERLSAELLSLKNSQALDHAAKVTGGYLGPWSEGTFVYVGYFNGKHLAATNYHVVSANGCNKEENDGFFSRVFFYSLPESVIFCTKVLVLEKSVDFALVEIEETGSNGLDSLPPSKFNFEGIAGKGTELITLGYGSYLSEPYIESRTPQVSMDEFCKVFSEADDVRLAIDPDKINPASYRAWSTVIGCEISHGDSGSAVFDRNEAGVIHGLVWTGAFPKPSIVRSYLGVKGLFDGASEDSWQSLNYAIPAAKIYEFLQTWLKGSHEEDTESTVRSWLAFSVES